MSLFIFLGAQICSAQDEMQFVHLQWEEFNQQMELQKEKDRKSGLSYVISGSLALIGGIVGSNVAEDAAEKGIYTVFQTIGVASVGYGVYTWQIGGAERTIYQSLNNAKLTDEQKTEFLKAYTLQRKEQEKRNRNIRAITHGLIAGLNFYNASQQQQESLKNTLNFIGTANFLAAISFTFEF